LENKFPYDECIFQYAANNRNLESMKWLLENKFPFDDYTFNSQLIMEI